MNLHAAIMNLSADKPSQTEVGKSIDKAYKCGHRDARHAAAGLALEADAEIERLRKDAERYRWLAARMLAADFDYSGERIQALVFEMPDGFSAGADCGKTIDAAMQMAPALGAA